MQSYDLIMVLVLVAATVFGFWKGMAWQIASLASLVVSYFAALRFSGQLAPMFGDHAPLNRFIAMFAIYIGTSSNP
jgi:membrane protein required for colicin V production